MDKMVRSRQLKPTLQHLTMLAIIVCIGIGTVMHNVAFMGANNPGAASIVIRAQQNVAIRGGTGTCPGSTTTALWARGGCPQQCEPLPGVSPAVSADSEAVEEDHTPQTIPSKPALKQQGRVVAADPEPLAAAVAAVPAVDVKPPSKPTADAGAAPAVAPQPAVVKAKPPAKQATAVAVTADSGRPQEFQRVVSTNSTGGCVSNNVAMIPNCYGDSVDAPSPCTGNARVSNTPVCVYVRGCTDDRTRCHLDEARASSHCFSR